MRRLCGTMLGSLVLAFACAGPAKAALSPEIAVGSTGLGISVSKHLKQHRALRLEYDAINFGGYRLTTNTNDTLVPVGGGTPVGAQLLFNDTFKPSAISLLLDQHFATTPWYVSGGIAMDLNSLDAASSPAQSTFEYNGGTYNGSTFGALYVHVHWNTYVPYFGVGFQPQAKPGQTTTHAMRLELGAFAQGPRRITVNPSGLVAANLGIFQPYVQAFQNAVPTHMPKLSIYPVARLSVPIGR